MSSFTSKNIRDLYEAYNSVYIDETELFLNDLLDTVTESVNELVNEGYDLSDYSWDEIYESFLENVLEPELEEVESFITQLNESTEELTEEQIENLLQERLGGLLSGLGNLLKGRQAAQTATQTLTRAPKPSIIQAPPVKPGAPATPAAPSSNPLYAPGVSSGRPTRPSVTPPPGADKGTFARFGDFLSSLTAKGKRQAPATPSPATPSLATPPPTPPKPPTGTPKPPGYQPTNLRGIDLRPALSAVRSTTGKLKAATYDKLPKNVRRFIKGATVATLASPLVGVAGRDIIRATTGGPSVTQTAAARAQQAYGVGEIGLGKLQGIVDPVGGQETVQSGQANVRAGSQSIADVKKKERERNRQGTTSQRDPLTGLPIYQHYEVDLNGKESINEVLVQGKDGKWYDAEFDKNGKKISQIEVTPKPEAIDRYNRLRQQNQAKAKPVPPPDPQNKPKPPKPEPRNRLDDPIAGKGPKGNEVGSKPKPDSSTSPADPAPAPPRQPAPQPARQESPVAKYMTAAAAARKSGDPAEMAKVRDMGMEIWRKSNPKLAAAADERERIRGTAQSDNPLLDKMGLRSGMRAGSPTVQSPTLEKDLGNLAPNYTRLTQNPNAGISPTPKPTTTYGGATGVKPVPGGTSVAGAVKPVSGAPSQDAKVSVAPASSETNKVGDALSANRLPKEKDKPVKKEAYDIVLDYLFSEGHVDTLSEAHYVMMQMDAEHIQSIIEGGFPGTPSTPRAGDAGTSGLKMIQTGGTTGYMNKHSGGNVLPKGTVNSIMKGDLMVKTKNNTNSNLA